MLYKILMIAPTPFFADRGCHVRIYEEIMALQNLGHSVTLCTYHHGDNLPGIDIRRTVRIPWYQKLSAGPSWHKLYLDLLLYGLVRKILSREKYDIIHAHLHEGVFVAHRLGKRYSIPVIADFQGSMTDEIKAHKFGFNHRLLMRFLLWIEKRISKMPDFVIASSSQSLEFFKQKFKIPSEKLRLVTDGMSPRQPPINPKDASNLKSRLGIPSDRLIVAYLGVLTSYQGLDLLMSIIPKVIQEVRNVHFLIMGYPNEKLYRQKCVENQLENRVTFTGRVSYLKASEYLHLADVAISPKISETEANGKLFNYMAAGVPTVVFESIINREILGDLGLYAKFRDADDFSVQLVSILRDAEKRAQLKTLLKKKAYSEFSWDKKIREIISIYEDAKHLISKSQKS